jgi:uncharacterized protein with HEPN domain
MPSRTEHLALRGILENIVLAQTFSQGMTLDEFKADRRTVYATTRCLEIISEASRRLTPELQKRHPSIDWIKVAASGNIYRHGYQVVSDEILWNTLQQALEPLKVVVEGELRRLEAK